MKPIYQVPPVKEGNPVVSILLFLLIAPIILFAITFWSICSFFEWLGQSDAYKASDPDQAFSKWGRDPLSSCESLSESTERRVGARGLQEPPDLPLYSEHPEPKRL